MDDAHEPAAEVAGLSDPVTGSPVGPDHPSFRYDEMAFLSENCAEYDLPWNGTAEVERTSFALADGRRIAALAWGSGPPRVLLLHGGAQNAHTWDTVALALRPSPVLAVDLAGHGHSSWRDDGRYDPRSLAGDVVEVLDRLGGVDLLVGMSLGGLTATAAAAARPDLVGRMVAVDITPGVTRDKAREVHDFIEGPQSFPSFRAIFDRTVEFNPTRSPASLRRGILHNAHRTPDGSWEWNYDRRPGDPGSFPEPSSLWEDVAAATMPYLLVRGGTSPVVDDDDVAELRRRNPAARVVVVDGAGHSVQGDRPRELADLLTAELAAVGVDDAR
jgi:esterase